MNENLTPNIRAYAAERQLQIAIQLGSGKDGIVWAAQHETDPVKVALKAHRHVEFYLRERDVYERLKQKDISEVSGFNVPELRGFDDRRQIIEMTIVRRPFVLDFAGAYLDARPEFSEDVWTDWEAEKSAQFEDRWPMVQKILDSFEELGIYLLDVSPANIAFRE